MIDRANAFFVTVLLRAPAALHARMRREEGQAFVEYALVLLLVAVFLTVGAATFISPFRNAITDAFTAIGNAISGASTSATTPVT
jgi:Flp pilus assembly pilin Flp